MSETNVYVLIREAADQEGDPLDVAAEAVRRLSAPDLRRIAVHLLADAIRNHRRITVARIEKNAYRNEHNRLKRETIAHNIAVHGTDRPDWGRHLREAIEDFRQEIRLELTAELLGSDFALGDGTRVTWGAATIAEHRQRVAFLTRGVEGELRTAALHEEAIGLLESTGAPCLSAVPGQAVAA